MIRHRDEPPLEAPADEPPDAPDDAQAGSGIRSRRPSSSASASSEIHPAAVEVDRFAKRIARFTSERTHRQLIDEVRAQPDGGVALLRMLMKHRSNQAGFWAAGVARELFGAAAVPWLLEMADDRRTFARDTAMQELAEIDVGLLRPLIPSMQRILLRSKPPAALYSAGGAAMWRLVRLRDQESAPVLRRFAAQQDPRTYDHRMPMVLADYLDDPTSLLRRIKNHDHEWMLWLAMAAAQLELPGVEDALEEGAEGLPDQVCREICAERLRGMRNRQATTARSSDISEH